MDKKSLRRCLVGLLASALLSTACISNEPRKTYTFTNPAARSLEAIATQEIRVATANIAGTRRANLNFAKVIYALLTGVDYTDRNVLEAYAQFADSHEIDVFGMQEVELESQYMGYHNQAAIILNLTDRFGYGAAAAHFNTAIFCTSVFNHGNAILARYKLSESEVETILDKVPWLSLDAMLYKSLDIICGHKKILATSMTYSGEKGEEKLYLINFHASTLGEGIREAEMRILAQYVAEHAPAIIMGDMNTVPKEQNGELHMRWKIFFDELSMQGIEISTDERYNFSNGQCVAPELYTSTAENPYKAIDIIMAANRKGSKYTYSVADTKAVNVKTQDGMPASDHIAVVCVIEVE